MHKLLKYGLVTMTLAFLQIGLVSANLHEDELGIENSSSLRATIAERLLTNDLRSVDEKKISEFEELIKRRRHQLSVTERETIYSEQITKAKKEEKAVKKADKKAAEQDLMIVADYVLKLTKDIRALKEPIKIQSLAKKILKIESSFVKEGRYHMIKEVLGVFAVQLFERHFVPVAAGKRPLPSNLVNVEEKRYYTQEELARMYESGSKDISELNPPNGSFWSEPENVGSVDIGKIVKEADLPTEYYYKKVKKSDHHPKLKVYSKNGKKKTSWKFKIGQEVNAEFIGMRFMQLMGFKTDEMFYLRRPKLYFDSKEEKDEMIYEWLDFYAGAHDELPHKLIESEGFETAEGKNKGKYYVVFYEATIETRPKNEERVGSFKMNDLGAWEKREVRAQMLLQGFIGSGDIKEAHNNKIKLIKNGDDYDVEELIHDIGKILGTPLQGLQANKFPYSWVKTRGRGKHKKISFNYKRYHIINNGKKEKNPFLVGHYSDIKWAARLLSQVTQKQIEDIMYYSGLPRPLAELYIKKLINRRNEVVEAFDLVGAKTADNRSVELFKVDESREINIEEKGEVVVKKGKLVKNFYEQGYPMNYVNAPPHIMGALSSIAALAIQDLSNMSLSQKIIPIDLPNRIVTTTDAYEKEFYFGLVTFKFHRQFEKIDGRLVSRNVQKITDTLQIRLNVGGKIKSLTLPFEVEAKGKAFVGREFSRSYFVEHNKEALWGNWDKLLALPFNWKRYVNNSVLDDKKIGLQEDESITIADIVGAEQGADITVGVPMLIGAGAGVDASQSVVGQTTLTKGKDGMVNVKMERGPGYEFSASLFTKYFGLLKMKHLSYGIFGGKSTIRNYEFDLNKPSDKIDLVGLVHLGNKKRIDELDFISEEIKHYRGSEARASFLGASRVVRKEGTKGLFTNTVGDTYRYLEFVTDKERSRTAGSISVHAEAKNEYKGQTDEIANSEINIVVEIDDPSTWNGELTGYIKRFNTLAADDEFIIFDPATFNKERWEIVTANMDITFQEPVIACLLEKVGCPDKEAGKKIQRAVKRFQKRKRDRSQLKAISVWLANNTMRKPELIKEMVEYFGKDNFRTEVYIHGEFLPFESRSIHRIREAK